MRRLLPLIIALLAVASITLAVAAQSGGSYSLVRSVVGNSASVSSGGSYTLNGTAGQSATGLSGAGSTALSSGFWTTSIVVPTAVQLVLTGSAENALTIPLYLIFFCTLALSILLFKINRQFA